MLRELSLEYFLSHFKNAEMSGRPDCSVALTESMLRCGLDPYGFVL